jgi:hypothetical protein
VVSFMLVALHLGQEISQIYLMLLPCSQTPSYQGVEGAKCPICLVLVTFKHLCFLFCKQNW